MAAQPELSPLPVDQVIPEIIAHLKATGSVVLRAPTGSGKTTRVAPAILDSGSALHGHAGVTGQVIMLEPRRVAARAAARRIASERGTVVGGEIGYQVRFDSRVGPNTRLRIVTDGILLRMLQDDPFLENVAAIIFDEFHERGLNVDLALGMVRRIQQTVRPDLKIVVMSATLAAEGIANYLGNAPIVEAQGRLFPVEVEYLGYSGPHTDWFGKQTEELLERAVVKAIKSTTGSLLVFLPGVGEIRRAEKQLESLAALHNMVVFTLFGDLPPEQQDLVLAPHVQRKLILATNVAETSITIDGVTAVVDSGLVRVLKFDDQVGMDRLEMSCISKASADQRLGRAGRTTAGRCYRLWSERAHRSLPDFEVPEVLRVDLASSVLQLRCFGEDAERFPWFEAPRPQAISAAVNLLELLGAMDAAGVTALGTRLARLPVHPRVARLLIEGQQLECSEEASIAAALLTERDPIITGFVTTRKPQLRTGVSESDVVDRVCAIQHFAQTGSENTPFGHLHRAGARFILQAARQLADIVYRESHAVADQVFESTSANEALQRALLAAYPDRVACRRVVSHERGVMVGGRGVRLNIRTQVTEAPLFICVNVDAGGKEADVRMASAIKQEWLDPKHLATRDEVFFDDRADRVSAVRRLVWRDLVLEESQLGHIPEARIVEVLAVAASRSMNRVVPREGDTADYLDRVRSLREWMPELELPECNDSDLAQLLPNVCQGCRTLDDIKHAPWLPWIKTLLTHSQQQAVDREAPERIAVPSGNRIAIRYSPGKRPVLAVKIQELFGLPETPRIAAGRVPLLLHLLAPNMRPQQVTDDLQSFWNNTYQRVRKDLRARYPKHSWPEDPWNAPPQRRPGKR